MPRGRRGRKQSLARMQRRAEALGSKKMERRVARMEGVERVDPNEPRIRKATPHVAIERPRANPEQQAMNRAALTAAMLVGCPTLAAMPGTPEAPRVIEETRRATCLGCGKLCQGRSMLRCPRELPAEVALRLFLPPEVLAADAAEILT